MANLGTKGTVLKASNALKIAGDPSSGSLTQQVSDYLGFGSYSGADCKVIVHFPRVTEVGTILDREKIKYESELYTYDAQIASMQRAIEASGGELGPDQIIQLMDRRQVLEQQLEKIDKEIEDFKNWPTSKVIAELQTISYSIYREKSPVRTLGSVYPRAYVRGPRTIGGSMVFTVFHQHVLHEILSINLGFYNTGTHDTDKHHYTTNLPDQLPPLDISLVFANEYGALSHMGLYGVEFVQEGTTFSIEDIFSENVVQYVARDMDPMTLVSERAVDKQGVQNEWTITGSSLLQEQQYRNNHLYRRNQFI